MGPLKEEYRTTGMRSHRRTASELASSPMSGQLTTERPDVLPGPSDVADGAQEQYGGVSIRRKDSVARMTWDGLSYVVTVSYFDVKANRTRSSISLANWKKLATGVANTKG